MTPVSRWDPFGETLILRDGDRQVRKVLIQLLPPPVSFLTVCVFLTRKKAPPRLCAGSGAGPTGRLYERARYGRWYSCGPPSSGRQPFDLGVKGRAGLGEQVAAERLRQAQE
jgi:hypothetical protein